jgi:diguanylate cyclase (GGDEF)-like protein
LVPEVGDTARGDTDGRAGHDPSAPTDRRLRWSVRLFAGSFDALTLVVLLGLLRDPSPVDVLLALLVAFVGVAALIERRAVGSIEAGRRLEVESFARILRGLGRSVSPDSVVAAIVEELGIGTGADHVVVVRRRAESGTLEATLHATRPGVPSSSTSLPLSDLDDPIEDAAGAAAVIATSGEARVAAIPIEPELAPVAVGRTLLLGPADRPAPTVIAFSRRSARPAHVISVGDGAEDRIARRIAWRVRGVYGLKHTVAVPLRVDGRVEGAIVLSRRTAGAWSEGALRIVEAAAVEASAALARVDSLRQAESRASTDALTGLPNRRYFDEYVSLLAERRRADDRLGLLMVDIDRFKRLNDTFGHAVGDHVLRAVAGAIARAVREHDVPARFGGEEFAVLLRNPSPDIAYEVGERVRRSVGELDLRRLGVPSVSVSVGVAVAEGPGGSVDALIEEADRALYRAKRTGRDRVVAA